MNWDDLKKNMENTVRPKSITAVMPRHSSSIMTGFSPGIMPMTTPIKKVLSNKRILELLEKK